MWAETRTLKLVVVDDNPIIRESIAIAVARMNERLSGTDTQLELFSAEDGATAWDRVKEEKSDLIVVDLYIPVIGGIELISRIREDPKTATIKILAVSASIQDARDRSLAAGADQFLQKPIRLVDVVDALGSLLRLDLP